MAPTLAVADTSATEGENLAFTVSLDAVNDQDVTFDTAATPGSAGPEDFEETVGSATIPSATTR